MGGEDCVANSSFCAPHFGRVWGTSAAPPKSLVPIQVRSGRFAGRICVSEINFMKQFHETTTPQHGFCKHVYKLGETILALLTAMSLSFKTHGRIARSSASVTVRAQCVLCNHNRGN